MQSTKSEDLQDQLKELTKNEQRRKETIVRLEREITALQKQVENKPEDSGTAKYNAIIVSHLTVARRVEVLMIFFHYVEGEAAPPRRTWSQDL